MTTFVDTPLDNEFYKTFINPMILQHCRNTRSKIPLLRDYDFLRVIDAAMSDYFVDQNYTLRHFLIGQSGVTYSTIEDDCKFASVFIFADMYSALNNTIGRLLDEFVKPLPTPPVSGSNNLVCGYVSSSEPVKVIFTSQ